MDPPPSTSAAGNAFHALEAARALAILGSSEAGLGQAEAEARLAQHGPNALPPAPRRSALERFLSQFNNTVIYVLLGAGAITAFLSHWVDCSVIFGVVIINAVIGFIQEGKAEDAIAAVRRLLSLQAAVLRDGQRRAVPARDLVPGDVILLESGDRVPADARLLSLRELRVDEAMLTGESEPVEKVLDPATVTAQVADRRCIVYSGTMVTLGRASAVVVATGAETEIGRISTLLAAVESITTPLLRQLSAFGRWLTGVILAVVSGIWVYGVYVRGYPSHEMFLAMVGVAVSAIPEALPAIITITLAVGVQRMAARKAIIRRLPAVETLGSISVICTDKTGTLTRNEMRVCRVATADQRDFEVTGSGYGPRGGFRIRGAEITPGAFPVLVETARAAMLCNESVLRDTGTNWELVGDPTDGALMALAMKARLEQKAVLREQPRRDVIPFESAHRFMASLHGGVPGHARIYVKGAPEAVLARCARQRKAEGEEPLDAAYWQSVVRTLGEQGERPIAMAVRDCDPRQQALVLEDVRDLTILGIAGIMDTPRDEARQSIGLCRSAGIRVMMVTGDYAGTAAAIAGQVGLESSGRPLTGPDIDAMSDAELENAVESAAVFARTSPAHKLRLVKALQQRGHVVAMTGDGVNDAPALKRADVGVAMGIKGTEVAKDAAQVVLADDNFASIVSAVAEGRAVYDNVRKAILYILPTNGGESFTILLAIAFGLVLPITPAHILWINMVTEVTLSISLAFEPAEPDIMRRPPRAPGAALLSGFMVWRIVLVSILMVASTFGLFLYETGSGAGVEMARTVAVNTLVVTQSAYLLNTRYLYAPVLNRAGLTGNRVIWIGIAAVMLMQLLFTYAPPLQALFDTRPLGVGAWTRIMAAGLFVFVTVELEKILLRRR